MVNYVAGMDVGSTTTKAVVVAGKEEKICFSDYVRHHADLNGSVLAMLEKIKAALPEGAAFGLVLSGSGAKPIAEALGVPYVQEVVANAAAIRKLYPQARTAIELGGQDAKVVFFERDDNGRIQVSDMRMNGSCAGGTGAFIDEIASLLDVLPEEYEALAEAGNSVYDISGRCGVYAKTDIQPLLNQGVTKEDIALSALHAIAKQTIGGLAQGLVMEAPVIFEGGPLHFHPTLVRVFGERLHLGDGDIIVPEHSELMVAVGAAIYGQGECEESRTADAYAKRLKEAAKSRADRAEAEPFFADEEEYRAFVQRHCASGGADQPKTMPNEIIAYLGIDCGSTTSKFVLTDEAGEIIYSFYASNEGNPVEVIRNALLAMQEEFDRRKIKLHIRSVASTGYGELLMKKAFRTEAHTVETVAHAKASERFVKDATFILDIGGQDMKAIWMDHGIITNIVLNEACSSGCGSFLEAFARNLKISVDEIAEKAFSSKHPAQLGSRCTVFMNSSIITEQRNGKKPEDIMAGLCRSIIENVFTKVIRVSNLDSLGERIVVQGGTFCNDAVLRAMEQYLGRTVIRAPYPGLMGAIGAAMVAKEAAEKVDFRQTFIGMEGLRDFAMEQSTGVVCPHCTNHCKRTVVTFSTGDRWVTNNRCERGAVLDDTAETAVKKKRGTDGFAFRRSLVFSHYEYERVSEEKHITIGLPRVLAYWETMPFWSTFFPSLGFDILLSPESTRDIYEDGLSAVTSDTECFPAKLVHGHIRWLERAGADRIFFPSITAMRSENQEETSESLCGIVKGYPIVIRNSDNPAGRSDCILDAPLFHWHRTEDRDSQLCDYMKETFGIPAKEVRQAILFADRALSEFHRKLTEKGQQLLAQAKEEGRFAVVLAARPYQNDRLVSHDIARMFCEAGISVIPADAIPDLGKINIKNSRLDVVNNFHARMLASAVYAAEHEELEYVQMVSFGCGHDAYLTDEIIRMMHEISGKTPLVLKVDESDNTGPLGIRIRSFIETVEMKRQKKQRQEVRLPGDPYPQKFEKSDVKERIVFVPNTSHAFCRVMSAAMETQHIRAVPLPIGREDAIRLGKQYVHNDICFPAQVVIGEALEAVGKEEYKDKEKAIAMGKYIGCCRLTHYAALLRKALDDAGYADVPILTNDDKDAHNLHPGFRMNVLSAAKIAVALPMVDVLEDLLRKIRPYETVPGSADKAFELAMDEIVEAVRHSRPIKVMRHLKQAVGYFLKVPYDRSKLRPQVLIVGEYLLNFHPGANNDIERYLEKNGFEIAEARMSDVIQKTYFYQQAQVEEYHIKKPLAEKMYLKTANRLFDLAHDMVDKAARMHPLYHPAKKMKDLVKGSDGIIHHTYDSGEGVLIPAEIIEHAKEGCKAFIILQPFGCIPNHVVGRGIARKLKEMFPDIQLLPLDFDPDVSFANIENRLQMLIMNAKYGKMAGEAV